MKEKFLFDNKVRLNALTTAGKLNLDVLVKKPLVAGASTSNLYNGNKAYPIQVAVASGNPLK